MSRIRANQITNQSADGAPTVQNGLVISGVTTSTTFSGSGASLTNIPSAQLTGALPAISGANLTGITQTAINNNANNRVITGSGTANTLEGESTLTYNGSTLIFADTSGDAYIQYGAHSTIANNFVLGAQGDGTFRLFNGTYASGTERLRITSDGKIGINLDDNTTADLQVCTPSTSHGLLRIGGNNTTGVGIDIDYSNTGHTKTTFKQNYRASQATAEMSFESGFFTFISGTGSDERLRILSDGKIGINNNSPNTQLQVTSQTVNATTISTTNSKQLGLWIQSTGGSNTTGHIENGIAFAEGYAGLYSIDAGSGAASSLAFFTGAAAGVAERLRITSDGHTLFSGLTTKNDPRNAKGITVKSTDGISFQNYGSNGSRNWRIRPDDMSRWGDLDVSVSPTANSATDWPDAAADKVLTFGYDGQVTKPRQASFAAMKSGNQYSLNNEVFPFDTTTHNIGSHFNTSNYRFTAPVAGRYLFTFYSILNSSGQGRYEILINGSADQNGTRVHMTPNTSNWDHVSTSWILNLAANDYIQMYSQTNTGWHGGHWQRFCGELLS